MDKRRGPHKAPQYIYSSQPIRISVIVYHSLNDSCVHASINISSVYSLQILLSSHENTIMAYIILAPLSLETSCNTGHCNPSNSDCMCKGPLRNPRHNTSLRTLSLPVGVSFLRTPIVASGFPWDWHRVPFQGMTGTRFILLIFAVLAQLLRFHSAPLYTTVYVVAHNVHFMSR